MIHDMVFNCHTQQGLGRSGNEISAMMSQAVLGHFGLIATAPPGRLCHGIYHPKSGILHLRCIPWYVQNRKMVLVYIMVYTR
jgi:hypothetical protein